MTHHTSLSRLNLCLYLAIVALVVVYGQELLWAIVELPNYTRHKIRSPRETKMLEQAKAEMGGGGDPQRALVLLEASIEIDPNSEAVFWLGEYYYRSRQFEEAMPQFLRYLAIDPSDLNTYLRLAAIHRRRRELDGAREVLREGIAYFSRFSEQYKPAADDTVNAFFRLKAARVYSRLRWSLRTLEAELQRLEGLEE